MASYINVMWKLDFVDSVNNKIITIFIVQRTYVLGLHAQIFGKKLLCRLSMEKMILLRSFISIQQIKNHIFRTYKKMLADKNQQLYKVTSSIFCCLPKKIHQKQYQIYGHQAINSFIPSQRIVG